MAAAAAPAGDGAGDKGYRHVSETLMSLRIEIYDRHPVTGLETLSVRRQMNRVDPTKTAGEFALQVYNEIKDKYPETKAGKVVQKYSDASPRLGWAFFVPENAEAVGEWADLQEKVEDVRGARQFKAFKPQYLDMDRTLYSYNITNMCVLHYKRRQRPISVDVFGQTKRVLIDDGWTVYEIVEEIGHLLDITDWDQYSLKSIDDANDPEAGWLRGGQTLHDQHINIIKNEDDADGTKTKVAPLIFKKKLFVQTDNSIDTEDESVLYLLYQQCHDMVINSQLPVTETEVVLLASMQLQLEAGDHDEHVHKPGYIANIANFLPREYVRVNKIDTQIYKKHKNLKRTTRVDALKKYVKMCRSNPNYGWAFFPVTEFVVFGRKSKDMPRLLGISGEGIIRLDPETKKPIVKHTWTDVAGWGENSRGFFVKFNNEDNPFVCLPANRQRTVPILIQYCIDYLDMFNRKGRTRAEDEKTTKSLWDDNLPQGRAGMSMGTTKKKKTADGKELPDPGTVSEGPQKPTAEVAQEVATLVEAFNVPAPAAVPYVPDASVPQEGRENDRLEKLSGSRGDAKELAAAMMVVTAELASIAKSPAQNGGTMLGATQALSAYTAELATAAATTAGLSNDAQKITDANRDAIAKANALLNAAKLLSLGALGPDAGALGDDLLRAAKAMTDALNNMLGALGVSATPADLQNSLQSLAELAHNLIKALAEEGNRTVFTDMIRSEADQIKARLNSLPNFSQELIHNIGLQGQALSQPAIQTSLAKKANLLLKMLNKVMDDVPSTLDKLLAASQAVRDALNALINGVDKSCKPDFGRDMAEALENMRKAIPALLSNLQDADNEKACMNAVSGFAAQLGRLATLEAEALGDCGSHDSLLAAARALSDALARLRGLCANPATADAEEAACRAAAAALLDAGNNLLMERNQIQKMREICDAAREVVKATADTTGALPAKLSPDDGRTASEASTAAARLLAACNVYQVAPRNLAKQEEMLQAARNVSRRGTPLVALGNLTAGTLTGDPADALLKAAKALADALSKLQGKITEATQSGWMLDVNQAMEQIRDAAKLLENNRALSEQGKLTPNNMATSGKELAAGSVPPPADIRTQFQWQDNALRSKDALPPLSSKLSGDAARGATADVGQGSKDFASEISTLAYTVAGLASTTGHTATQHDLIVAGEAVLADAIAVVSASAAVTKAPNNNMQVHALEAAVETMNSSLARLAMALPGLGDCEKGASTISNASLALDDAPPAGGGMADLMSVAAMLAGAMKNFAVAETPAEKAKVEQVARQDAVGIFTNEISSAGRSLLSAVNKLEEAAKAAPDSLGEIARAVTSITLAVLESTQAAARTPELQNDAHTIIANLKAMSDSVAAALSNSRAVGVDPENEKAVQALRTSDVGDGIQSLKSAVKTATTVNVDTGALDQAVAMIKAALPKLNVDTLPAASTTMSIKALQDSLLAAANALGESMKSLSDAAAADPRAVGRCANDTAMGAVRLINATQATAASVTVTGEGITSVRPAVDAIREALKATTTAMVGVLQAQPTDDQVFKAAVTQLVLAVRDLIAAVEKGAAVVDPAMRDALMDSAGKLKSLVSKLAKSAGERIKDPSSEAAHTAFMTQAKSLMSKAKALEKVLDEIPVEEGDGHSSNSLKGALCDRGVAVGTGVMELIGVAKVLLADSLDVASHNLLKKTFKKAIAQLAALGAAAKLVLPGQKECAAAIEIAMAEAAELNKASLDFSVQRLTPANVVTPFNDNLQRLVNDVAALAAATSKLGQAGSSSADALGPAATELAALLPELTQAAIAVAVTAVDPVLGQRVLREAKDVPEELVSFIQACQNAGGDPKAAPAVQEELAKALTTINEVKMVLEADEAARLDCDAAAKAIMNAAKVLNENTQDKLVPGASYADYQKHLKKSLAPLAKTTAALVSQATTDPSKIGESAKKMADAFPNIMSHLCGNIALTTEDLRPGLQKAGRDLAWVTKNLIDAAKNVQGGNADVTGINKGVEAVSGALTGLLKLVEQGATGLRALDSALAKIDSSVNSLNTAEFMLSTSKLANESGTTFADANKRVGGDIKDLAEEVAKEVYTAENEEQLGAAATHVAKSLAHLLEGIELAVATLDNDDDQHALLAAAKALAAAMSNLLRGAGAAAAATPGGKPDTVLLDEVKASLGNLVKATRLCGESGSRTSEALAETKARIAEVGARLDQGSAAADGPMEVVADTARALLRATQKLFFAAKKNPKQMLATAATLPDSVAALVDGYRAAVRTKDAGQVAASLAAMKAMVAAVQALLDAAAVRGDENALSEAAKNVSQAITTVLYSTRDLADAEESGGDPMAAFEKEMARIEATIEEAKARIAALKERPPKADLPMDTFVNIIIKACGDITTASGILVNTAVAAHRENVGAGHEDMIIASRNVAAATDELVSAATAFVNEEADESALERAAKVISTAIFEIINAALNKQDASSPAQTGLKKAAKAVGKACQALIDAAQSHRNGGAAGGDDDGDDNESLASSTGEANSADAKAELQKRAEIAALEKQLQQMNQPKKKKKVAAKKIVKADE